MQTVSAMLYIVTSFTDRKGTCDERDHSKGTSNGLYLGGTSMANLSKAGGTRETREALDRRASCLRLQDGISTLVPLSV